MRRRLLVGMGLAAAVLTACEEVPEPSGPGGGAPTPTATMPLEESTGHDFCQLVSPQEATRVALQVQAATDVLHDEYGELRLVGRRVTPQGDRGYEECSYGTGIGAGPTPVVVTVYPDGRPTDRPGIPPDAEPRDALGPDAYFLQSDTWFYVSAPAGDAWLTLWGLFFADTDPLAAEDGLTRLLRLARDRLPAGATLQGRIAGEECGRFDGAVARALGGAPEATRQVTAGDSLECQFASFTRRSSGHIRYLPGTADELRPHLDFTGRELDGIDGGWLVDGRVQIYQGGDVIEVYLALPGRATLDQSADFSVDEALAVEVRDILADH